MLKLGRVAQFKMLFLVLVFVFNFELFKFSAAILEKGLFQQLESRSQKKSGLQRDSNSGFGIPVSRRSRVRIVLKPWFLQASAFQELN